MPHFKNSTHKKHWVLKSSQLQEIRTSVHSQFTTKLAGHLLVQESELTQFELNIQEQEAVIINLSDNLFKAGFHLTLPPKVISTAVQYFRRFYLYHSICEFDPIHLMYTSLYVACKTEEINIGDAQRFCSYFKHTDPQHILKYEIVLISGIKFHLYIFAPFKPLDAILEMLKKYEMSESDLDSIKSKATSLIYDSLLTDLIYTTTPAMIAITAVWILIQDRMNAIEMMDSILSSLNTASSYSAIATHLQLISQQINGAKLALEEAQKLFRGASKKAQSLRRKLHKALARVTQAPMMVRDK